MSCLEQYQGLFFQCLCPFSYRRPEQRSRCPLRQRPWVLPEALQAGGAADRGQGQGGEEEERTNAEHNGDVLKKKKNVMKKNLHARTVMKEKRKKIHTSIGNQVLKAIYNYSTCFYRVYYI